MALDFLLCDCINSCDEPLVLVWKIQQQTMYLLAKSLYFNHVGDVCDMLPVSCTGQNAA